MKDLIRRAARRLRLPLVPGARRHRRNEDRRGRAAVLPAPSRPLPAQEESALRARRRLALVLAADFGIDLDRHVIGAPAVAA